MKNNKRIIDTNILIYGVDSNSSFNEKSQEILHSNLEISLTHNSLLEFVRVQTSKPYLKSIDYDSLLSPLDIFVQKYDILFPSQKTDTILRSLIQELKPKSGKIFDLLILAQAIEHEIPEIITANDKDFPKDWGIKITNPFL